MKKYIGQHIFDYVASFRQNVGIGTDTPTGELHVSNVAQFYTDLDGSDSAVVFKEQGGNAWRIGNKSANDAFNITQSDSSLSTNVRFTVANGGNVGIGTESPDSLLEITSSSVTDFLKLTSTSGSANPIKLIFEKSSTEQGIIEYNRNGDFEIYNNDSDGGVMIDGSASAGADFYVANSGNVLIGTTTDNNSRLRILGATSDATKSALEIRDSSASALFTVRNDGRIDTSGNLNVGGDLTVSGTTTTINTTNLNVEDKNITINYSTGDSTSTADGAGITIQDAVDSSTDATLLWNTSNSTFNFSHGIRVPDNVKIQAGNGGDFDIFHTGSATTIDNATGHLNIQNSADDSDIVFKSDDGSGGLTTYFKVDGGETRVIFDKEIRAKDSVKINVGNSTDGRFLHDGTDTKLVTITGDLRLENTNDDGDIKFICDDGSGGTTEYFRLDGDVGYMIASKAIRALDSVNLQLGASADFTMQHNGTKTLLQNFTGNLEIIQNTDDGDILFQSDNGSGGLATYYQIDGGSMKNNFFKDLLLIDNVKARFGSGSDLQVYHNGSNSYIEATGTGDLYIQQTTDNKDIIFQSDDGSGGVTTYFKLDGSVGGGSTVHTVFPDNSKAVFGTGLDTQIYHDGTNSYIKQQGGGNLIILQTAADQDIIFQSDDGSGGETSYFVLDGDIGYNRFYKHGRFEDNVEARFGTGNDMKIYHDGTNNYIQGVNGDLYIQNGSDDKDIILRSDDGSGGQTAYITLDGSAGHTFASKNIRFLDSVSAVFGTSSDMYLFHDGSNGSIRNDTGNLTIFNNTDDGDIIFQADDGSGGLETYFFLDGSASSGNPITIFPDNSYLQFGNGMDLGIAHDGSNSNFTNVTGNLNFINYADDKDIIFQSDDGSGGVTTYLYLDGSNAITRAEKEIRFADSVKATFGNAADLDIYHDSTNSYVQNDTGDLYIENKADDKDVRFQCDDGSGGTQIYFMLDGSEERISTKVNNRFDDSFRLELGTSGDLDLYHDGSHSYINNTTGDLIIRNQADDEDILFQCDNGSGGDTTYLTLDGSLTRTIASQHLQMADGKALYVGAGSDAGFYHLSGHNYIENNTGDLIIVQNTDDGDIKFQSDDGSGGVVEYMRIDGDDERIVFSKDVKLQDNDILRLGSGNDLKIHHDGSNSYIQQSGTGSLIIQQTVDDGDILFRSDDGTGSFTEYFRLDGGLSYTVAVKTIRFNDNQKAALGSGLDMQLYHNGSHSYIENNTGNIAITNNTDDGDIIFSSDDGSGGTTEYFRVDGGAETNIFSKPVQVGVDDTGHDVIFYGATSDMYLQWDESDNSLKLRDNVKLKIGSGNDLAIHHSGTQSEIKNLTGNLIIQNTSDDSDIIFKTDNGSGGTTTYLTLDGGNTRTLFSQEARFSDSVNLKFGSGGDTMIYHDGSDSYIDHTGTGHLYIRQGSDDNDIIFQSDDQSGGLTTYLTIDGSNGYIRLEDDRRLTIGSGNDLQLRHTSSGTFITNFTHDFNIVQQAADKDMTFQCDDGSGDVATYFMLDGSLADGSNYYTKWVDNSIAAFGNDPNLFIFHDSSNSYIRQFTAHDLIIENIGTDKDIIFKADDGSGSRTAYLTLDGGEGHITVQKEMHFQDTVVARFGTDNDAQIVHSGSNLSMVNQTGNFNIVQNANDGDITLQCDDGSGGTTTYITLDGGLGRTNIHKRVRVDDNIQFQLGSDGDIQFSHTGSIGYLYNNTGDFRFRQNADDKDFIFQCDDGSGGVTDYMRIDGSHSRVVFSNNVQAAFGSSSRFVIFHDGTEATMRETVGDLTIQQLADDKDIIFKCDDGSGGSKEYFRLDGSAATSAGITTTLFPDNSKLKLGTGGDFVLFHDGTDSTITNNNGDVIIQNAADDKDVILKSDNGSGGTTAYITLDGSDVNTTINTIKVLMPNLPTSDPARAGQLYNAEGTLKISLG